MSDQDVVPKLPMLGKVQIITLALAIKAGGAMPSLEEIGEADLSLGSPKWTRRGHPRWVAHLYQRGLAAKGQITVEGRSSLHWALLKQGLPAPLAEWVKATIGDDDV